MNAGIALTLKRLERGDEPLEIVRGCLGEHLERTGIEPGTQLELDLALDRYFAVAARTFADARRGDIILYEDAYQNVAIAISGGNAASMFSIRPGQEIRISPVA